MIEELYLSLYEPRTVSLLPRGSTHGIGREEILGAASAAKAKHPLGDRVVLAVMGDQRSISKLAVWANGILPDLCQEVVVVALGRPLPEQLEQLIKVSPRYSRAIAKARQLRSQATHEHKTGNHHRAQELELEADRVLQTEREHSKANILVNGKCPRCRGTGRMERKDEPCPICNGTGNVIPSVGDVLKKHGPEVYSKFVRLVDIMQMDKSDWMRLFMRQIGAERTA